MRWSQTLIPTIKEDPKEAEVLSHKLMLRAGLIRRLASGLYTFLPVGLRVLKKVENIVRQEMNGKGAIELLMPMLQPKELWEQSGRWDEMGPEMMRIKNRNEREFVLAPTHEEIITDFVSKEVKSYRDLPKNFYQINIKFRDEIRPRFGLIRAREFIMKDAYSFDVDEKGVQKSYQDMWEAYSAIFNRCGLKYEIVEADTGFMGGKSSHEFMVPADNGEDTIVFCSDCDYRASLEKAEVGRKEEKKEESKNKTEVVDTPGVKTIDDLVKFLKIDSKKMIKILFYKADDRLIACLIRGDKDLSEIKLKRFLGCSILEMANDEIVKKMCGVPLGFAGPVGLKGAKIIADYSVLGIVDGVTGANKDGKHIINVNVERDYKIDQTEDLSVATSGDECPRCKTGKLSVERAIEVGHIFNLGKKYSEALNAKFLDEDGKEKITIMGCYGIGVTRTVQAIIECNNDKDGIVWPKEVAPFQVLIVPVEVHEKAVFDAAEKIYNQLIAQGIEVILDDRDERPGVKFKDADLIGIPIRVNVSKKTLEKGGFELRERGEKKNKIVKEDKIIGMIEKLL